MEIRPGVPAFLYRSLKKYKGYLLLSLLCALLMVGASIASFDLVRSLFDQALRDRNMAKAFQFCGILVGLFFVSGLVTYGNRFFLRSATERVVFDLRKSIFDRLLIFSQLQLNHYSSGRAVGHIISDVGVVANGLHVVADLILSPLMAIGILSYLFYLNWKLTLFCFVMLPIVAWIGKVLGRGARKNQTQIQTALERISSHIVDSIRGLRTAHAFGQTRRLRNEFNDYNERNRHHALRLAGIEETVAPLTKWVTTVAGAGIISFGAYLVIVDQSLTEGALIAFLTAAGGLLQPLRQLNQVHVRLQTVFAATTRIVEVLEESLDTLASDQAKLLEVSGPMPQFAEEFRTLEFRSLSFRFPLRNSLSQTATSTDTEAWALKNINFTLSKGESVALVGESGSGKSTLSHLALRFLDPQEGSLLVNDRFVRDIPLAEYRSLFSYVSQDVHIFQKSLRLNLLFAKPDANDEEIWNALERAAIADFVRALPYGLDTELGEQASKISGGERQRIGIARAFLRNSPILILDEITSQLDSKSEAKIQLAMKELFKGRSVLMIAHRLSTIRQADRVVVLASGSIVESGRPEELLGQSGSLFQSFWKTQNEGGREASSQ